MILKKIITNRFRRLGDRLIELQPGLNIIKGSDNEVGKSSLRMAIVQGFYQTPSTRKKEVVELTTWGETEKWYIEISFVAEGKDYRLIKDLENRSAQLINQTDQENITDDAEIARKIGQLNGCPSRGLFESTACVGQEGTIELVPSSLVRNEIQQATGTIKSRLQSIISGTESKDFSPILQKLKNKARSRGVQSLVAKIQDLQTRILNLQRDKDELEQKVAKLMENRRKLLKTEGDLSAIEKGLVLKREFYEKSMEIAKIEEELSSSKEQFDFYRRAEQLRSVLRDYDEGLRIYRFSQDSEEKVNEFRTKCSKQNELEEKRNQLNHKLSGETKQVKSKSLWLAAVCLLIISLIGSMFASFAWIGVFLSVCLMLFAFEQANRRKYNVQTIETQIANFDSDISRLNTEIENILEEFGHHNVQELLKAYNDYRQKSVARKETNDKLSGIIGEKGWEEFRSENDDLEIQIRGAQKQLKKLLPFKEQGLSLQSLEQEVRKLEDNQKKLTVEEQALRKFFEYSDADPDQLVSVNEQLGMYQKELDYWQRKQRVYETAYINLEEAYTSMLSKTTQVLNVDLGKDISYITDGRYSNVEVDENDLSISALSPEKNEKVSIDDLSKATQDQLYICARLALVRLITDGKNPPLLLDDPFVNYHPKRLKKTIELLQEISKNTQILMFTCSDAYDNVGNVVHLG